MRYISFRTLLTGLLFVGFIPLLLLIGLIVYSFQRTYLMEQAKSQLSSFIRVEIENLDPNSNLSLLAVQTGERIRPLGADLFIKDKDGKPVPPALGIGPWLEDAIHKNALIHQKAQFHTIHTDSGDRLVFLSPILSSEGMALGTLESSISLSGIQTQLLVLQRWLILLIGFSVFLVGIISQGISTFSLRPIQNLVKTAEKVREGDLHTRASTTSIIEINELALTLNQMLTRLEKDIDTQRKLNQTMRQFAADASHELRSPLMVFNNSVDLLRKFVEEKNFLQMIEILNVLER
ncbi:HAMP domain-containing protein, partial [Anaerolinea sp.]|uniref:HAMP domain-containing protein n=1 Tax=Anaerolinea sp. TaxID=1872519 RepID=UPI002ACE273F